MAVTALIVDDSAVARRLASYHLRRAGCTVVGEAASAFEALESFHRLKPNIITLDLVMPIKDEVDSMAVVRAVKKEVPETAIIVVSVIPSEKVQQDFFTEGVFGYVVKPFNDDALETLRPKLERAFPELAAHK